MRRASAVGTDPPSRVVYAPPSDWVASEVFLRGPELHHVARVLRFRVGERVEAVDGAGSRALVEIVEINRAEARCAIVSRKPCEARPPIAVRLAPAVIRGHRMDWLVEKATELGAAALQPVYGEHSTVRPLARGAAGSRDRWERIAIAAMKQSRRARCPVVAGPVSLEDYLGARDRTARLLVPWERAEGSLRTTLARNPLAAADAVDLLVGPEGGFSDSETAAAREAGGEPVRIGRSVLRAETAAIAALLIVLHEGGCL